MKISIVATSHRQKSQSQRISNILQSNLNSLDSNLDLFSLDLAEIALPLWSPDKKIEMEFGEIRGKEYQTI